MKLVQTPVVGACWRLLSFVLILQPGFSSLAAPAPAPLTPVHQAPPVSPGDLKAPLDKVRQDAPAKGFELSAATTAYVHGDPTDEEQLFLEYINRARANANAEALRLAATTDPAVLSAISQFQVSLPEMVNQFATLTQVAQPLAFNSKLIQAARLHSQDQFNNQFQGHVSSSNPVSPNQPGDTIGTRATRQNYTYSNVGENVFSTASSVFYGHAGFEIDWGSGPFGMQSPPGHRNSIHNPTYREIGVGNRLGLNGGTGPIVVTQVFGKQQSGTGFDVPFLTGVAYLDIDGDQFYSPGEGLTGITLEVAGANYHAITSASGGYAIPLPNTNAAYTVTISGPSIATFTQEVTITGLQNKKLDFAPAFTLPTPAGSTALTTGQTASYTLGTVPGADGFSLRASQTSTTSWLEGAEGPASTYTLTTTGAFTNVQSTIKASGTNAFGLVHTNPATDQFLLLNRDIIPTATSNLTFLSRLGFATANEVAVVQISNDGGATWTEIFAQPGNDASENSFTQKTVSLALYAN